MIDYRKERTETERALSSILIRGIAELVRMCEPEWIASAMKKGQHREELVPREQVMRVVMQMRHEHDRALADSSTPRPDPECGREPGPCTAPRVHPAQRYCHDCGRAKPALPSSDSEGGGR